MVLYDGSNSVKVLLSSHEPVRALPCLAQIWGLQAGVAGAAGVSLAYAVTAPANVPRMYLMVQLIMLLETVAASE